MTRLLPWLQLIRLPTLFTAMADVLMGYLMTSFVLKPAEFVPLLASSSALYLSGMVFNDVFDRAQDARERPERPIPSGRISLTAAAVFGVVLMTIGLGCAAWAGPLSLKIAGMLAVAILLYDGVLKRTPLGPVAMGSCRFFNVMLAASSIGLWESLWARPQLLAAAGLGVYVIGLTWFARNEARNSRRWELVLATIVAVGGLGLLALLMVQWTSGVDNPLHTMLLLGVVLIGVLRRAIVAIRNPEPQRIQATIRTMLLSIVTIDATLILFKTGSVPFSLAAILLLIPALVTRRWIPMT